MRKIYEYVQILKYLTFLTVIIIIENYSTYNVTMGTQFEYMLTKKPLCYHHILHM